MAIAAYGVSASSVVWPGGFCGAQRPDKAGSPEVAKLVLQPRGAWRFVAVAWLAGPTRHSRADQRRSGPEAACCPTRARGGRTWPDAWLSPASTSPCARLTSGTETWRSRCGGIMRQRTSELAASGQALSVVGRRGSVAGTRVRRHAAHAMRSSRGKKPRYRGPDTGAAKRSTGPRSRRNTIMPRCAASAAAEAQRAE